MLSHHHKTIFVHIPKCAGQSVEMAFLSDLGLTWETRAPLLLRANDQAELGPPRLAHLTAADYVQKSYVPQEMFDSYYKFAVVRDPWSRAVSLYRHLDLNMPFSAFVADWLAEQFERRDQADSYWFVRPQTEFLLRDGKLLVDDVIRFEALAEEFPRVALACHLENPLPHVNRSAGRAAAQAHARMSGVRRLKRRLRTALTKDHRDAADDWADFYDDAIAQAVGRTYAADITAFGYSYGG